MPCLGHQCISYPFEDRSFDIQSYIVIPNTIHLVFECLSMAYNDDSTDGTESSPIHSLGESRIT